MPAIKSQLTSASTVLWSGGEPFNGYVLLLMALPNYSGTVWTRVSLRDCKPKLRIPTRVKIPIREGVYDVDTRLWQTTSIIPPGVKYSSFFYDDTDRLIAVGPDLFTVTVDPYVLAPPTLTDPTASVVSPAPEDVPSTLISGAFYNAPLRENVSGTKNDINTLFTISRSVYSVVLLIWNQTVLDEGVHYTISGANITMLSPFIPGSTDTFEAVIF